MVSLAFVLAGASGKQTPLNIILPLESHLPLISCLVGFGKSPLTLLPQLSWLFVHDLFSLMNFLFIQKENSNLNNKFFFKVVCLLLQSRMCSYYNHATDYKGYYISEVYRSTSILDFNLALTSHIPHKLATSRLLKPL